MEIVLLVIGILVLFASAVWYIFQPGFSPLIAVLTGLAFLIGSWRTYKQKMGQSIIPGANPVTKSMSYDILPISFELRLRQEIPHINIWLYVVNFESKDLVLDTILYCGWNLGQI